MAVWSSPLGPGTCSQFGPGLGGPLFSNQRIGAFCFPPASLAANTSRTCPVDPPVCDHAATVAHGTVDADPPARPHSPIPNGIGVLLADVLSGFFVPSQTAVSAGAGSPVPGSLPGD